MLGGLVRKAARGMGVGRGPMGAPGGAQADPGAARRAMLAGGGLRGMLKGRGPFGGAIQQKGQGGFKALAEPAMAPQPGPAPAQGMQEAWSAEMATPEPSPYGPAAIRPENAPNRWNTRRMAGLNMLG